MMPRLGRVADRHGGTVHLHRTLATTAAVILAMIGPPADAQSTKLERGDLPRAVENTLAAETRDATIRGIVTEVDRGQRVFEVALTIDGHVRVLEIDEQGHLLETEDEVPLAIVPPAVKAGLKKAAGKGTIVKVETLTKNGKLVAYEADVKTGTRRWEVQVGPDGKKLTHPE
jgi:hypothetical protein